MSDYVSGRKKLDVETKQRSSCETNSSDKSVYKSSAESSVRYKGSKESSVYKGSEEYFEYFCDPCSSTGDHLEADGFCTKCEEYLCGTCFRSHSRGKATRNHTLLEKDNMPRKSAKTCDPCKTAEEEIDAVGYCDDCDEYLCNSCFRSHSRSKATKHHTLKDKDTMPEKFNSVVSSFSSKIDIQKGCADYQKKNEEYTYIHDLNVKAEEDEKDPHIVGMALISDSELALADYKNKYVKLVDIERNVIKETMELESEPFGLAEMSRDQAAVVLSNIREIKIIRFSRNMSVQRTMKFKGKCLQIEYLNGKLYASFKKPVHFKIFLTSDEVYKTISPHSEMLKHCSSPWYFAVSSDESYIYVSDRDTNKFICIDMNGNMISMYQNDILTPADVTISPFGSVYLCNKDEHVVYSMPASLIKATVVLGRSNGLLYPELMCFNADKRHMYIYSACDKYRNSVKVYEWQ